MFADVVESINRNLMDFVVLFNNLKDISIGEALFKISLFKVTMGFKNSFEDFRFALEEFVPVKIHGFELLFDQLVEALL